MHWPIFQNMFLTLTHLIATRGCHFKIVTRPEAYLTSSPHVPRPRTNIQPSHTRFFSEAPNKMWCSHCFLSRTFFTYFQRIRSISKILLSTVSPITHQILYRLLPSLPLRKDNSNTLQMRCRAYLARYYSSHGVEVIFSGNPLPFLPDRVVFTSLKKRK